jgi:hypothetical protein
MGEERDKGSNRKEASRDSQDGERVTPDTLLSWLVPVLIKWGQQNLTCKWLMGAVA